MKIEIKNNCLVDISTGEVIADYTEKFNDLTYEDYVKQHVLYFEPQDAKALDSVKLKNLIAKGDEIAEIKFDGHRGLMHLNIDANRLFSRNVSKETGWLGENTDQLPQLRDLKIPEELAGTILDGEILIDLPNCDCRMVQSVTGALPEKAIEWQLNNKFAHLQAFDIIKYKNYRVTALPLWKRKLLLADVVERINSPFIKLGTIYVTNNRLYENCSRYIGERNMGKGFNGFKGLTLENLYKYTHKIDSFEELYANVLAQGKEGLMLKSIYAPYEHKRTSNFIKMKPNLTFDVVIMGYEEPEHYFEGKTLREGGVWEYWEDAEDETLISEHPYTEGEASSVGLIAVTKFYAKDWIGAVKFGVYKFFTWDYLHEHFGDNGVETMLDNEELIPTKENGAKMLVEVGQTSGMTEEIRKKISENKNEMLGKVIEVKAQRIIDPETGSLQHPRFSKFREDKDEDMCTFEAHLSSGGLN